MIQSLELQDVGPAPHIKIEFEPRLNVLTGDNGLGKSFVLDVAWWVMTGEWAGRPAWPREDATEARIVAKLTYRPDPGEEKIAELTKKEPGGVFQLARQEWSPLFHHDSTKSIPRCLIFYARADGSFSAWDPLRNHLMLRPRYRLSAIDLVGQKPSHILERLPAYHFSQQQIWDGITVNERSFCDGLLRDWVTWQRQPNQDEHSPFAHLKQVLSSLSHPDELMLPGPPRRLYLDDVREYPTVILPYGTLPVVHASSGMQRALSLAYLLVWHWHEHLLTCKYLKQKPTSNIMLLIDEVEDHLHPRWQRTIVPALIQVFEALVEKPRVQLLLTTHSPLVLASLEPLFDPERDKLLLFELKRLGDALPQVTLQDWPWRNRGDASMWLTSEVFGLQQARSKEAEDAIRWAEAWMRGARKEIPAKVRSRRALQELLEKVLSAQDRFWPRWLVATETAAR